MVKEKKKAMGKLKKEVEGGDDKLNKDNVKKYYCPKCRSNDIESVSRLKRFFWSKSKFRCNKCKYEEVVFPLLITKESKGKKKGK